MRSIWKGAISFGLVSVPVKLYSATEEHDVSFHQVHRDDGGRIRYRRVCSADGQEVSYADIAKGFELPSGEVVILDDDDFASLPLRSSRNIDVLTFVPLEQVDPMYYNRSYYLEPEPAGVKPYVLLRNALQESGRVAVVKVALRQREQLAALRVKDGVFVLETMLWPDEIRAADFPFLAEDVQVRSQELTMATSLIETLAGDFDPDQYADEYRDALQQLIDAKIAGREVVEPPEGAEQPGGVVDLMAALRASVEAARQARGEAGDGAGAAAEAARAAAGASDGQAGGGAGRRSSGRRTGARADTGRADGAAPDGADTGRADGAASDGAAAGHRGRSKPAPGDGAAEQRPAKRTSRRKSA
jgi:DNA end-binding protein Ku